MRFVIPIIAAVVMINGLVVGSSAQTVSFGLVAGGYDNQDFDSLFEPGPLDVAGRPFPPTVVQPDSGGYIVGPSLEIHWSQRISLRVEALNKPLHYQDGAAFNQDNVPIGFAPNTVVTWQSRSSLNTNSPRPLESVPRRRTIVSFSRQSESVGPVPRGRQRRGRSRGSVAETQDCAESPLYTLGRRRLGSGRAHKTRPTGVLGRFQLRSSF